MYPLTCDGTSAPRSSMSVSSSGTDFRRALRPGSSPGPSRPVGELRVDRLHEVVGDPGDHLGELDRLRDVVDEVDQDREVDHQQGLGHRGGEVRDEVLAGAVDGDERQDRVHERPDEDAERDLVADVADEVPHHPGPELLRRQRQRQDRDGEHHADDRDDGGGDGDEHLALGVGGPRADPGREVDVPWNAARSISNVTRNRRTETTMRMVGTTHSVVRSSSQRQLGS